MIFNENLVWLKLQPEPAALAFYYLEPGQSQYWAITNGLAWPGPNGLSLAWLTALSWAGHITNTDTGSQSPTHPASQWGSSMLNPSRSTGWQKVQWQQWNSCSGVCTSTSSVRFCYLYWRIIGWMAPPPLLPDSEWDAASYPVFSWHAATLHQEDDILVLGFLLVLTCFQVFEYLETWKLRNPP